MRSQGGKDQYVSVVVVVFLGTYMLAHVVTARHLILTH